MREGDDKYQEIRNECWRANCTRAEMQAMVEYQGLLSAATKSGSSTAHKALKAQMSEEGNKHYGEALNKVLALSLHESRAAPEYGKLRIPPRSLPENYDKEDEGEVPDSKPNMS